MSEELIPPSILTKLPKLYETENNNSPIVYIKLYHPLNNREWYILESDQEEILFALVKGFETELGYCSLAELIENGVMRDLTFKEKPLNEIREEIQNDF